MRDVTLKIGNEKELDIRIDERQSIAETLQVLRENRKIFYENDIQKIFSVRKQQYINVLLSYEQAEIYNGDKLVIER